MLQIVSAIQAEAAEITKWDRFAVALSDLTRAHGIGLQGAVAYQMEGEDHLFDYAVSEDGDVIRC